MKDKTEAPRRLVPLRLAFIVKQKTPTPTPGPGKIQPRAGVRDSGFFDVSGATCPHPFLGSESGPEGTGFRSERGIPRASESGDTPSITGFEAAKFNYIAGSPR